MKKIIKRELKNHNKLIIFMPSMEGGGVEKNIILISNYLSKYLNDISLITFDNRFNNQFDKKIEIINHTKKILNVTKYYKYLICLINLTKQILTNKNSSVFSFQANIYALILCKLLNVKIIIRSNSSPLGWSKSTFKTFIFRIFFKLADKIIVNSQEFKKQLDNKLNVNSLLIYNPLNKKEINKKSKKKIKFNFFNSNKSKMLKIINIGRFTDQKDQVTLLKAINEIYKKIKLKLLIIGYGKNEKILKSFVKKNRLSNQVKIINFQKNPFPFLKKSDLFILSSKFEGLPNVILEAIVLKKFVISSKCPTGPREILLNGKYGFLFKIGDYKSLAKLILKYSKNKKHSKKKIDEAYKSLHRFNFEKNCRKYLRTVKKYLIEK
jgi:glycosyltransferase involved in cell wall biosynthesis